jgi:hypothetical protein
MPKSLIFELFFKKISDLSHRRPRWFALVRDGKLVREVVTIYN